MNMLKKQTVWLLTMLSLIIVLSVYYMTSDTEDIAYIDTNDPSFEQTVQQDNHEDVNNEDVEIESMSEMQGSELFTTIRMELEDERNIKKDRLKEIVASSSATAAEINEALNEIDTLEKIQTKETILQETISASSDQFEDVLVRAEDDKVHVHVMTEELTRNEAVQIMQMVKDELGDVRVDVNFQGIDR